VAFGEPRSKRDGTPLSTQREHYHRAMGSIEAYQTAKGKRYRVLYRRPNNVQTQKRGFATKRSAELFLAEVEVSKSRGSYIDPSKSRITVSAWVDEWMQTRSDWKPTSRERVRGIVELHVRPRLGDLPLGGLSHATIQQWAGSLSATMAPASVRRVVNVLSGALQMAVADGRLPANPARNLKLPKSVTHARQYLTHDQVRALAAAVDDEGDRFKGSEHGLGLVVLVLAYCGLRWGELSGLRVGDIDFDRGRLEIQHTVVELDGVQMESSPKSYESRSIPVPATVLAGIRARVEGRNSGEPVFAAPKSGGWLRNRSFRRGWFDAAAASVDLAGLTPHELRHTAASLAISAGANVKAVQRMLGHASASVTLDVYSDLFDSDLDAVSLALDKAIARSNVAISLPDVPK
jgi:integrase